MPGTDLSQLDLTALARGFGCPSRRASGAGDLETKLAEALDHDGPYLLDVPVATTSAPLY